MLLSITLALLIAVAMGFKAMSYRFDHISKHRKLNGLSSYPLVSVLVPAYKSEKTIAKTLQSVRKSDYPNKEIIVVNDSDDSTPEIAKAFGAHVIQNSRRTGKAAALNRAAEAANGDFLLILDSDATLKKATLTTLMKSYNSYEENGERVGIVAPMYTASNKKNFIARLSDAEQALHQNLMKIQMNIGSILSIRGSCMLLSRQAFDDAGGFSHTLLEDGDFTAKVIKSGYKIKYEPLASVSIREPETLSSLLSAKKRYGKGTLYCTLRHVNPYIVSPQAFVCFYPQLLLMLAVIGTLFFQNPLTLAPISILLATFTLSGTTSYVMIAGIMLLSAAGLLAGSYSAATANASRSGSIISTTLPFVLFFVPLVTIAYARGFLSGIFDKLHNRPELEFSNW